MHVLLTTVRTTENVRDEDFCLYHEDNSIEVLHSSMAEASGNGHPLSKTTKSANFKCESGLIKEFLHCYGRAPDSM